MSLKRTDKTIAFCFNPVSCREVDKVPVPDGMADRLIQPILKHLKSPYEFVNGPQSNRVNVYYSHRSQYPIVTPRGIRDREVGVFISHGIADKAWRDRVGDQYEHIFVSGPAWSAKMFGHHCPMHRIVEVGYAKLDPLFTGPGGAPIRGERSDRIRVVWAPTHGGGGMRAARANERPANASSAYRSSWWDRDEILAMLPEDTFEVVEAPHPRHRADRKATFNEYVGADVVIADGGSTIYEAMALDLPVVFPDWLTTDKLIAGTFEHQIYSENIGRHVDDQHKLASVVEAAANSGITEAEQEFIETILPRAYRGDSGRRHAEALDEIAQNVVATPHPPTMTMLRYRHRSGRTVDVPVGTKQERSYADSKWWMPVSAG